MTLLTKIAVTLVMVAFFAYATIFLSLLLIGNYLTPSDTLQKSDVIVVYSGEDSRTQWGIKLYQDGVAPYILFSGAALDKSGPSNAAAMRTEAIIAGVPKNAILVEELSNDTYENSVNSKKILNSINAHRIVLVTSPYHQRRAYETLRQVYGDESVGILNSPSGYSDWSAQNWWEKRSSAVIALSEFTKIILGNLTGGYS